MFLDSIISGVVIPFVAPLFTRAGLSRKANVAIVLFLCAAVAVFQQRGELSLSLEDGETLLASLGVIVTVSQGFYRMFKGTIEGIEGGVETALAVRSVPKTENLKSGAKVLLTDEIERQIEKQINERITRIMGVKDTAPVLDDEEPEVFDDYERVAG